MPQFKLTAQFKPTGDQPKAIEALVKNLQSGAPHQVLLGVTGSGKTFSMANVIEQTQKPTLIISHNKTLAAQLYQEFKEFFPQNSVNYFVSYYDYYQPEAYIPTTDTYIDKDAKINEELDRLRHSSIQNLLDRQDTIIVASVSCIYNIGLPSAYLDLSIEVKVGQTISRQNLLRQLSALQYDRKDINFGRGSFRVRGETIEIWPATGEKIIRLELKGNIISAIIVRQTEMTRDLFVKRETSVASQRLYPAKFWVAPKDKLKLAMDNIRLEMDGQLKKLKKQGKLLDAERLRRRTNYDLEMMKEVGYCHGIENYSRHLEFRAPDSPPYSLLDYFSHVRGGQNDFLTIIDESHMTVPQIGAMYEGDKARKQTLIDFGFRLPSALDNRPLKFKEFEEKIGPTIYTSATPGKYELGKSPIIVEQLIRPTGLLDPKISVRPSANQIPDLIKEIKKRVAKKQRVLVTTLTKRMAEDLAEYLTEEKIKTQYLHSEVKTLERPDILKKLREGHYDVLVGINLLREGLDLPEVSLVAILDADKEGFLRNATTLIQTIGRASRHLEGQAILYADKLTDSMKFAISETNRRRQTQETYNKKHHIDPQQIIKAIRESFGSAESKKPAKKEALLSGEYLREYIKELQFKADLANRNLQFDEEIKIKEEIEKLLASIRPASRSGKNIAKKK
ncbi:MAG TPA: excinuclease ABC subunit UvrB [Candidatus Portnoybacteria bacterium]|nr:excinuclease ABC subunit UvrB [Candidatus Portnoybacteria bacterium]